MAAQTVSLENDSLGIEWGANRGVIASVKDKVTGREWLDPAAGTPLCNPSQNRADRQRRKSVESFMALFRRWWAS